MPYETISATRPALATPPAAGLVLFAMRLDAVLPAAEEALGSSLVVVDGDAVGFPF